MARVEGGGGLRLLSLDGGGTRALGGLYVLRHLMGSVTGEEGGDDGGSVRPGQHFDLIAGSGVSGLCALLFSCYNYTVDQVIAFAEQLTCELDDVEAEHGETDAVEQLAERRQAIVQHAWAEAIRRNTPNLLDQHAHMDDDGVFDYRSPSAVTDPGRSKAFAVSSESQRFDEVSEHCRYHVPLLHRTYACRHGRTLYTLYAVGLATVASPRIFSPGVIFPELLATGRHTAHNPVRLMLEESNRLWPGLPIGALLSVGQTEFEIHDAVLHHSIIPAAEASLAIYQDNESCDKEMKRFVLPFDQGLAQSYHRFKFDGITSFTESTETILTRARVDEQFSYPRDATNRAVAVKKLQGIDIPTTPEDSLALASFASLLRAQTMAGYTRESAIVTNVISNFILYETAGGEDASYRKAEMAVAAEKLARKVPRAFAKYGSGDDEGHPEEPESQATRLLNLAVYGETPEGDAGRLMRLTTLFDYAAATYYASVVIRRGVATDLESSEFRTLLEEIRDLADDPSGSLRGSTTRMEALLNLIATAALCESATTQALRGIRGLAYNGRLIRHAQRLVLNTPCQNLARTLLNPIADFFALCMQLDIWSPAGDDSITKLIDLSPEPAEENPSLLNLAMERLALKESWTTDDTSSDCTKQCLAVSTSSNFLSWSTSALLLMSVESGLFGLLWRLLNRDITSDDDDEAAAERYKDLRNPGSNGDTILHHAARLAFPYILQKVIQYTGMATCRDLVDVPNQQGHTALHLAYMNRAPMKTRLLLLTLGTNINSQCNRGCTPLHYCFLEPEVLPPMYSDICNWVFEHALPTTLPLATSQVTTTRGSPKPTDPCVSESNVLIRGLLSNGADITILNSAGEPPLHTAARHGWGANLDIFFSTPSQSQEDELRRYKVLTHRDNIGLTILDHTRQSTPRAGMDRGEDTIIREMSKRGIPVPPASAREAWNQTPMWQRVPVQRSRTPTRGDDIVGPIPIRQTPSPQPVARFVKPIVFEDPEFAQTGEASTVGLGQHVEVSPSLSRGSSVEYGHDSKRVEEGQNTALPVGRGRPGVAEQKSGFFRKLRKGK